MAIKVKAIERNVAFEKNTEKWANVLQPELYNKLSQSKVISEASLRSGIPRGSINAAWDAIGEVIKAWATEGHSVAIPGLGSMRFGLRASSVADVNKVGTDLITTRRVIFTPNVDIKNELKKTSINITCYDRNGELVKRVTSSDDANVEDPEDDNPNGGGSGSGNQNQNQNENQGGSSSGSGSNTGNGGNSSGSSTGSETGGNQNQNENQNGTPVLTISKTGSGSASVSANGNAVSSGSELEAGTEVSISVTPAEGTVPTATLNGSNVALTENNGVYTGSFQMPSGNATLVINSGSTGGSDPTDVD